MMATASGSRDSRDSRSQVHILKPQVKWEDLYFYQKAADFAENGGIRERMTSARLGRRQMQNEEIAALKAEVERLKVENASLKRELAVLKGDSK